VPFAPIANVASRLLVRNMPPNCVVIKHMPLCCKLPTGKAGSDRMVSTMPAQAGQ